MVRTRRNRASISDLPGFSNMEEPRVLASRPQPGRVVMRLTNITAAWMLCAAFALPAMAQETHNPDDPLPGAEDVEAAAAPADDLKYQTGQIVLPNKVATLDLGERYRYLDAAETSRLLQGWGNPPNTSTQGAIVPADVNPFSERGWAVIITYKDDGHIDDSDAEDIDYEDLLEE